MTLREMLDIPVFKGFAVAAGQGGLDREVSTVSVMDAPDIYEWMKGGEFLITSGYVMKDDPDYITELIEKLDKWGATAFGIKLGRFIGTLPEEAVRTADRLNFPIIIIPIEFAFTEVINPVLQEIINRKSQEMLYTEKVHREFVRMAVEDRSISDILKTLEQYTYCETIFMDTNFNQVYFAGEGRKSALSDRAKAVAAREKPLAELTDHFKSHSLSTHSETYGILFFGEKLDGYDSSFENYYRITVEQAGVILILKAQKLLAQKRVEESYRELFVEDLLKSNFSTREEISNRARIYGWDFPDGGFTAVMDVNGIKAQYQSGFDRERDKLLTDAMEKITWISADVIRNVFPRAVYSRTSSQVIFAVSAACHDKEKLKRAVERAFDEVRQTVRNQIGRTLTIGIGSWKEDFYKVSESYDEAMRALNIAAEREQEDVIVFYDDLGVMKLLSRVSESEEAGELYDAYVRKLRDYDDRHDGNLVRTMQVLVNCDWNLKQASEALFIHYNSMKYRYRRICQILEKDLDSADEKLDMEIALKLDSFRHS